MTTDVRPTGEVHPAAELFPMLPDDELAELAADIEANGLLHPIVLDADGVLIDGRNRLAACRMAGVEPTFSALNGYDPVAYILGSNVARRHLNAGQRAMAAVAAQEYAKNIKQTALAAAADTEQSRISRAAIVKKYAPALVESVMSGAVPLNDAYAEAKRIKDGKTSDDAKFRELQIEDSDLAALVSEGRMHVREAWDLMRRRQKEEYDGRVRLTRQFWSDLTGLWSCLAPGVDRVLDAWIPHERGLQGAESFDRLLTADGIFDLAALLVGLADAVRERQEELRG